MGKIIVVVLGITTFIFFMSVYFELREALQISKGRVFNIKKILKGEFNKAELKKVGKKIGLVYIMLIIMAIIITVIENNY